MGFVCTTEISATCAWVWAAGCGKAKVLQINSNCRDGSNANRCRFENEADWYPFCLGSSTGKGSLAMACPLTAAEVAALSKGIEVISFDFADASSGVCALCHLMEMVEKDALPALQGVHV
eukprot:334537-Pelagomonas_calceolata.AAC.4